MSLYTFIVDVVDVHSTQPSCTFDAHGAKNTRVTSLQYWRPFSCLKKIFCENIWHKQNASVCKGLYFFHNECVCFLCRWKHHVKVCTTATHKINLTLQLVRLIHQLDRISKENLISLVSLQTIFCSVSELCAAHQHMWHTPKMKPPVREEERKQEVSERYFSLLPFDPEMRAP